MDNPFFRCVGRLVDLVWINILTLLCSIPVVTMGAAFTAMYRVLIRIAVNEDGMLTKEFFREFKNNLKKATIVWVPVLLILAILLSNAYLMRQGVLDEMGNLYILVGVSIGVIAMVAIIFLQYYFSIISRYRTDTLKAIKNSALLMLAYFPRSLCIFTICFFPIALMLVSDYFVWFWFLYGFSFPGYFVAMIIGRIFLKLEENEKNTGVIISEQRTV